MKSNTKGFTLIEILVAMGIMAIGFLAMSQMQYLSLKQKTTAASGTFATNLIETVSDLEMANAKRINLLNARVYLDSQANLTILNQDNYCDGSDDALCEECPCNPFDVFVSGAFDVLDPAGGTEITCAPVNSETFDPAEIEYFIDADDCQTVPGLDPNFYVFRRVNSTFNNGVTPNRINLDITYVIKSSNQFNRQANLDAMGSGTITNILFGDSLARQNYQISAHVERDWTNFITLADPGWNEVVVPHMP